MKGILLLIVAAVTMYVAGTYRVPAGLFTAVIEILLFLIMFIAVRRLRRKLSAKIVPIGEGLQRMRVMPCSLTVNNSGRLPVWFWDAVLVWSQDAPIGKRKLSGQVRDRGQEKVIFDVSAEHCGFITVTLLRMRVWDYLRLFRKRVKIKKKKRPMVRIPVFPERRVMQVESASGENVQIPGADQEPLPMVGQDVQEILQYREYQAGDSVKNIHWNLSAKNEEIWVKEYSKSEELRVGLFLDLVERGPMSMEHSDAFYEILMALLLGLLEKYDSVYTHWFCWEDKTMVTRRAASESECREILTTLYDTGRISADDIDEQIYLEERVSKLGNALLQFDQELRLSYGDPGSLLLKQFSVQNYRREIEEQKVVIP
ncbi:MAG: DUF58 domain-containing protein [Acetatifactor sp.]|nr:DUF58 domain-containing protein [Acetatifactor sp.]